MKDIGFHHVHPQEIGEGTWGCPGRQGNGDEQDKA